MSNPWFRMYKEFAHDPVVQSLAFEDQRHYVMVLCLKCDGLLDRKIAPSARDRIILRSLGLDAVAADEAKRRLTEVGLINKNWQPKSWNKRQFVSDHSTERSRKSRKNKEPCNGFATEGGSCSNAPETEAETETEAEEDRQGLTPCPHSEVIKIYHETLPMCPRVRDWHDTRQGYLRARWREKPERQDLGWWRDFFDYVLKSRFLIGQVESQGKKPFLADLEWLVKPTNFTKVIEGKYHD